MELMGVDMEKTWNNPCQQECHHSHEVSNDFVDVVCLVLHTVGATSKTCCAVWGGGGLVFLVFLNGA